MFDPITMSMMIGGGASALASLFGGEQADQGAEKAINQFNNLDPRLQQLFSRYLSGGQNPTGFVNQIYDAYEPSSAYRTAEENAMKAARNAAASGGQLGTYNHQNDFATRASQLASQDRQQWFQNTMMPYQMGLNATGSLADLLTRNAENLGSLYYKQGQDQAASTGGLFGGLASLAGGFYKGGYKGGASG